MISCSLISGSKVVPIFTSVPGIIYTVPACLCMKVTRSNWDLMRIITLRVATGYDNRSTVAGLRVSSLRTFCFIGSSMSSRIIFWTTLFSIPATLLASHE